MSNMLGKTIGQYQLIEFIARGETSVVYKGFQPDMNRYVAVKVLSPSLARDQATVQQFQREGELMSQLEHECITPVYDFGRLEGVSYRVGRFVDGVSLSRRLSEFHSPDNALQIVRPLADALDYLHGRDIVHGNLKPSNILLDAQDQPLLTNLGYSRRAGRVALPGSVYMSPEQAQGGAIDGRTDVYSLGVLLYEMMIGEPPPVGAVPGPRLKRPDLPTGVEKVILKAMAQYPEQRFQTAGAMSRALEQAVQPAAPPVVQKELAPAEPEPLVFPAPEPEQKQDNTWLMFALGGLAAVVLICAILAAIALLWGARFDLPYFSTPQPGVPTVTATTDINVRAGPGLEFGVVGVMRQGESAEVIGVSQDRQWWNIISPSAPGGQGWVTAIFVAAEGAENVPVIESPPTPTEEPATEVPPTPVPTEVPPTAVPTEVPPTAAPTDVLPSPVPTEVTPTSDSSLEPLPPIATVSPVPTQAPETGLPICGLAGLPALLLLIGLVRPAKQRLLPRRRDQ